MNEIKLKDGSKYTCNKIKNIELSKEILTCEIQPKSCGKYKKIEIYVEMIKNFDEIKNELEKKGGKLINA